VISIPVILILAAVIHADYHLARPATHHWSFGLWWHWASCIVVFALAGAYIARRWPADRWRVAAINVTLGIITGQVIEPLVEGIPFGDGLGWDVTPDRWAAFGWCMAAGIPALMLVLAIWPRRASGT
jgi:quinol-cytochrome oxidoreductase complex cytochrome b subunit